MITSELYEHCSTEEKVILLILKERIYFTDTKWMRLLTCAFFCSVLLQFTVGVFLP
jgi:hypothetical protein